MGRVGPVARRLGEGWVVLAEGWVPTAVTDLPAAEAHARKLLGSPTMAPHVDLQVEIPPSAQVRLELVTHLCGDAAVELAAARAELVEAGFAAVDVEWLTQREWP